MDNDNGINKTKPNKNCSIASLQTQVLQQSNHKAHHEALCEYCITHNQINSGIDFYKTLADGYYKFVSLARLLKAKSDSGYLNYLEKAFFVNPQDNALLTLISNSYNSQQKHLELLSFYNKLLDRFPHSAQIYTLRAGTFLKLNRYNPAQDSLQTAIALGAADNLDTAAHTLTNAMLSGLALPELTKLLKPCQKQKTAAEVIIRSGVINLPSGFFTRDSHLKKVLNTLPPNTPYQKVIINNIYPQLCGDRSSLQQKMQKTLQAIRQTKHKPNLEQVISQQHLQALAPRPSFFIDYYGLPESDIRQFREAFASLYDESRERPKPVNSGKIAIFCDRALPLFLKHFKTLINQWPHDKKLYLITDKAFEKDYRDHIDNSKCAVIYINPETIVATLKQQAFDLIFYFEVGTSALNYLLPFLRLSPIQATGLGIPSTSGQNCMDYMLQQSSFLKADSMQAFYTETLILNPNVVLQKPLTPQTLDAQGLPKGHLYLFHHYHFKIHPDMDEVLLKIIAQDAKARFIFGYQPSFSTLCELKERLHNNLGDSSYQKHILFMHDQNLDQLFSIIKKAHVALDTFYFGMGTTALECIYHGLPIITYPNSSQTHISRVVHEIYSALNSPLIEQYCVADNKDDYIAKAINLACNPALNQQIKAELRACLPNLENTQGAAITSLSQQLLELSF